MTVNRRKRKGDHMSRKAILSLILAGGTLVFILFGGSALVEVVGADEVVVKQSVVTGNLEF
jgi:hypothetical protein